MKRILVAFIAVLISACSGTPAEPTQIPTATAIPLSAIDLRPVLFQQGDLPASIEAGQVRDFAPEMFNGLPKAENTVYMQLSSGQDAGSSGRACRREERPPAPLSSHLRYSIPAQ